MQQEERGRWGEYRWLADQGLQYISETFVDERWWLRFHLQCKEASLDSDMTTCVDLKDYETHVEENRLNG